MPVCSGNHYFVYCINLIHNRIDILDSIDYIWRNTDPEVRNRPIAEKMPIISAAFQKVTNNKFPRFGNWDRAFIDLPKQAGPNDCMFFLWKYMEFWDGDRLNIDINPVSYYFTIFIFSICACDFSNPYLPFFPPCALLFVPFFLQFKGMIYMIELMHYCIFHALNQADLPDELDVYRLGGRKIVWNE